MEWETKVQLDRIEDKLDEALDIIFSEESKEGEEEEDEKEEDGREYEQ